MNTSRFYIDVPGEETLTRGDAVEHREYGPMVVDGIRIGSSYKRVTLALEQGPESLQLTGEDVREARAETLHSNPAELYGGETRYTHEGISINGVAIEATITVEGTPDTAAEGVAAHIVNAAVRAMEAVRDGRPPSECAGTYDLDWETIIGNLNHDARLVDFAERDSQ